MIVVDRLLVGGLRFVLDNIAGVVERELENPERLKEELLAAQMRLELGEIDDAEYVRLEADVLARMRTLRTADDDPPGAISFDDEDARVDVSIDGETGGG